MLMELHNIRQELEAQPKTRNPLKAWKRHLLLDEVYDRIHAEIDRRIAEKI